MTHYSVFISFTLYLAHSRNVVLKHSVLFPFSTEFSRHCMLSGGTQRCALSWQQREEMIWSNISFPRMKIEPTTCYVYSRKLYLVFASRFIPSRISRASVLSGTFVSFDEGLGYWGYEKKNLIYQFPERLSNPQPSHL